MSGHEFPVSGDSAFRFSLSAPRLESREEIEARDGFGVARQRADEAVYRRRSWPVRVVVEKTQRAWERVAELLDPVAVAESGIGEQAWRREIAEAEDELEQRRFQARQMTTGADAGPPASCADPAFNLLVTEAYNAAQAIGCREDVQDDLHRADVIAQWAADDEVVAADLSGELDGWGA